MLSVQQKARWSVSSSQDTSQPRVVADPGYVHVLLGANQTSPSHGENRGSSPLGSANDSVTWQWTCSSTTAIAYFLSIPNATYSYQPMRSSLRPAPRTDQQPEH